MVILIVRLIEGRIDSFNADPGIVNLNPYQKPLFLEQDGTIKINDLVGQLDSDI